MDFVYIWYDYRCWSKILLGTNHIPTFDREVKVMHGLRNFMLKFCVKVFKISYFLNPCMDLLYIWHDNRYWSKILLSTIPTPAYILEVKVKDIEIYV